MPLTKLMSIYTLWISFLVDKFMCTNYEYGFLTATVQFPNAYLVVRYNFGLI